MEASSPAKFFSLSRVVGPHGSKPEDRRMGKGERTKEIPFSENTMVCLASQKK